MLKIFIDTFLNRNKGYQVPEIFLAQLEKFSFRSWSRHVSLI